LTTNFGSLCKKGPKTPNHWEKVAALGFVGSDVNRCQKPQQQLWLICNVQPTDSQKTVAGKPSIKTANTLELEF
jgi:hypothetical protein